MKGLAAILGAKGPAKAPAALEMPGEAVEEEETGGSAKEFARLASEAIADGDHEAAADALVSLVRAFK